MTSYPRLASRRFPRRRFLQVSAAAISGMALANCRQTTPGGESSPAAAPAAQSPAGSPTASGTLNIYTWADYSSEELYKRFTDKTGIQVVADVYDSNEVMLAKMQAGGGSQYSILYPSDYMVRQMIELGLLSELDPSRLQGMDTLRDRWQNPPYDPNNQHSVPVSWGTTGLIYNTDRITAAPTDWNFMWEQQAVLTPRKLTLLDDVRETMGATLKSLGYSYNATDPKQIEAAYNRLVKLKPAIASFESFGWEDRLIAGDLSMSMTYSLLGNILPADNPKLKYVIPQSGSSLWTDTMVIPKTAPNVDAAYAWINFMLEPENASFAVSQLKFATPSAPAFDLLPTELKENQTLFPPEDLLAKCEGIAAVGDALNLYDQFWTQLKSA